MSWKFTIINRFNEETVIEEPVGWDKNVAEIKRDTEWHGIFFSTQGEAFEFTGKAMQLLKKEYDEFGAEGYMLLVMSEDCGNGVEEFARGRFNFSKYEFYCGDYCFVKVPVENVSEIIDLRNRINQKVDLDQLKAFDEVTDLVPYSKLPFDILFPSKGIKVQNKAEVEHAGESTLDMFFGTQNVAWFQIVPQFDKVVFSEFGQFSTVDKPELTIIKWGPYSNNLETDFEIVVNGTFFTPPDTRKVIFDWARATPILHNDGNKNGFNDIKSFPLNIDYSFQFETKRGHIYSLYKIVVIRRKNGTFDYLAKDRIFSGTQGSYFGYNQSSIWDYETIHTVSFTANFPEVILSEGESLYVAVCGLGWATTVQPEGWRLTTQTGLVNMETLSYGQPTVSRVFAINETLSRITESITNDNVRAYSEYFGRKDSQPYNLPEDGEGSLAVLTDGIRIRRQENNIEGKTRVFSQSLKDVFEGMNPIHNIGMGVEPDPLRPGHNRLRVEKWDHFYNDAVAMSCIGVGEISRKTNEKEIYSTFEFGYAKWEAEEYNGLDEFLTKRNYRTTLSRVKNDLVNLSTFIASGYAIEITRRKGNENTKDWRYDKDVFIICVKRGDKSDFLVNFSAPNTVNVAIFNSEDYVLNFFQAGANITIDSPLNSGNHTVLSAVKIGNSLSVTLSGTVVNEFTTAGFTTNAGLAVEQGNVLNPVNIVDPDTIYNYRISPVRNAMRWMNKVLASYEKFDEGAKIIFTDGDGNYFASGQMEDNSGKLENGILSEDATLTPGKFIDSNKAKPFLETERISFEYPMSSREFKTIEANPYGLVYFENDCEEGLGWIDTIKYTPDEGLAEFVLIPAIEATPTGCIPVAIRGDMILPTSFIGVPYSHVVQLYGTAPFEIIDIVKPNWMTIAVSGTSIYLKGIPTNAGTFDVAWIAKNCGEGAAAYKSSIDVEAFICNAVEIAGTPELPDGYVNSIYNYSIYLTGDTPYALSIVQKPDWMTISLSGNAVTFAGTPLEDATGEVVSITIGNCSEDEVSFAGEIDITSVCLQSLIPDEELPNALIGFTYNYKIQIGGTAPFELTNIVKPSWMEITLDGSELIFSGNPDVAGEDIEISFTVGNCSEEDEVFSDTINVINTGGGILLQTNDIDNADQTILNFTDSDSVTWEDLGGGRVSARAIPGIWSGIGVPFTSYAKGDLIYASGADTLSKLAADTDGKVLTMQSGVPMWTTPAGGLPAMTGNDGKFLTTNGSVASWGALTGWSTSGNNILSTDFIGSANNLPVVFKANNIELMRLGVDTNKTVTYTGDVVTPAVSFLFNSGSRIIYGYQSFSVKAGTRSVANFYHNGAITLNASGVFSVEGVNDAASNLYVGLSTKALLVKKTLVGNTVINSWQFSSSSPSHYRHHLIIGQHETTTDTTVGNVFISGGKGVARSGNVVLGNTGTTANGSVLIGEDAPEISSVFTVISKTQGSIPAPRMTITDWNLIPNKAEGLQGWNTTDKAQLWFDGTRTIGFRHNGTKFQGFDGTNWIDLN